MSNSYAPQQANLAMPAMPWTPDQLVRLEFEWRRLQRAFAYHPSVRVNPIHGDPPGQYQIEYHVRTLAMTESGQLDYVEVCSLHMTLPPDFPYAGPTVRPLEAVFHPNISGDAVQLIPAWEAQSTLLDVITRLGEMLAFQSYDPWNVLNPAALEWLNANTDLLPTDAEASFKPDTGGEPIGRICRHGGGTLVQLRGQLRQMGEQLTDLNNAPSHHELLNFGQRMRMTVSLFLADDLPEALRKPAIELDEWAAQLKGQHKLFENFRRQKAATQAGLAAARELDDSNEAIRQQMRLLEAMNTAEPLGDPHKAMEQIPAIESCQEMQGTLKTTLHKAQQRMMQIKARLVHVTAPPPPLPTLQGPLDDFVRATARDQNNAAADAADIINASVRAIEPLIERMKLEIAAIDRIITWRDYANLSNQANELVRIILLWGSAGVQAYYMVNEEQQQFGPFAFEQRLDVGNAAVAVRNTGPLAIDCWNLLTGEKLGQSDDADLTVLVSDPQTKQSYPSSFRLTARCDDLSTQVGYYLSQTKHLLSLQQGPPALAPSWCGKYNRQLNSNLAAVNAEQERRNTLWGHLISDLQQMGPFKERLATYHMVDRLMEMVPRFLGELRHAREIYHKANRNIADIFAQCPKDLKTERPILAAKFANDYTANVQTRDAAKRDIIGVEAVLRILASHARKRLYSRTLYGDSTMPHLAALSALPDAMMNVTPGMVDEALLDRVTHLEKLLGRSLRPGTEPARSESPITTTAGQEVSEEELQVEMAQQDEAKGDDPFAQWVQEGDAAPIVEEAPTE